MKEIVDLKQKYPKRYRLLEILPGLASSFLVGSLIVGGIIFFIDPDLMRHPLAMALFLLIILYFVRWMIRGFEYALFTILSVFKLKQEEKVAYHQILQEYEGNTQSTSLPLLEKQRLENLYKAKNEILPSEIIHWLILPTYNESYEILHETMMKLASSDYNLSKIAVTIAGEKRKEKEFLPKARKLQECFSDTFGYLSVSVHPLNPETEFPGKGANITYAARKERKNIVGHFDTSPEYVCVTTLDADSNVDKTYFNHMTYTYLITEDRTHASYQPMIFFFNNFRDAPFFSKVVSLCNSFWIMFNAMKKYGTRNFSTHMQPLAGLLETDFWSTQTIVEDGHQFWRSYFAFGGNYKCVAVYTKVYQDCNLNDTQRDTALAQYKQMRRWSHGAEDIAYSLVAEYDIIKENEGKTHEKQKIISKRRSFYEIGRAIEGVILWSTLHLVLMGGIGFSMIQDIHFSSRLSLGGFVSISMRIAYIVMIVVILLQLIFCPWHKLNGKNKLREVMKFILLYIPLIGPILVIFSGLPAFHTQLALAFGNPMNNFNVTKKVRK